MWMILGGTAVAVLVAACGSDGPTPTVTEPETIEQQTTTTTTHTAGKTLSTISTVEEAKARLPAPADIRRLADVLHRALDGGSHSSTNYAAMITDINNVIDEGITYVNTQLVNATVGSERYNRLLLEKTQLENERRAAILEVNARQKAESDEPLESLDANIEKARALGILPGVLKEAGLDEVFPGLMP